MTWGTSLVGFAATLEAIQDLRFEFDDGVAYVVGPTVEYAVYVDQGTSKMEARPFVEPAAEQVQQNLMGEIGQFLDSDAADVAEDDIVKAAALAVQRNMQRIITQKGAVDTGTMRASVSIAKV